MFNSLKTVALSRYLFSQVDLEIALSYEAVSEKLVILLGEHYEIVFRLMEELKFSIVCIANSEHADRTIGSLITNLVLCMFCDITGADSNVSKACFTCTKSGVLMQSVTISIRNHEKRIIGLLCINMNLVVPFSKIIQTSVSPKTQKAAFSVNFVSPVDDSVAQTLEFAIAEVNVDRNVYNNAKNHQGFLNLYEKGMLDIRNSVDHVAGRLSISKYTICSYVCQFKSGDLVGSKC